MEYIQYILIIVWLLSHSIISLQFIHVVAMYQ